jgi:hypothetical protein
MVEIAPDAAAVEVSAPAVEAAAPTTATPTSSPEATAPVKQVSPPASKRKGALNKEIEWVTSPEESLELYAAWCATRAAAEGYLAGNADVRARAGATVAADLSLSRAPTAAEPDRELAAGGWAPVDRAEATSTLGGTLGAIEGLSIESITKSTTGTRPRVRVVQLTQSGERIVLTETRAGAAVRGGAGPAVVTALRLMPPSEAYQFSTGTASLGNLLITVKSSLAADALRVLLEGLGEEQ